MFKLQCYICKTKIDDDKYDDHLGTCLKSNKMDKYLNMNPLQEKAIRYINKKAKVYSKGVKDLLLLKVINLGYTKKDYKDLRKYFADLDAVVHCSAANFKFYNNDKFYKSTFEIRSPNYPARENWENNLFDNIYDKCDPRDRVKYGVINILNSKKGVASAHDYGRCYLKLKKSVRNRLSFVHGDSCAMQYHIANYKYFDHILYYLTDAVLTNILENFRKGVCPEIYYPYIEFQIHGDLRFDRDVEEVVVPNNTINNSDILKFVEDNKCKLSSY